MPKYRIIPVGGGGITPEGTLEIRSEGVFDVTDYAAVDVDIFDDTTTKNITLNGTYNAEDDHVLGYSQVTVDVPASAVDTGTKSDTITINGTSTIDVVGYASHEVTVAVPASAVDTGTKQITSNGNGQDVVGYASVDVNVQPSLQTKSNIDPTTSSQTITADQNYDGLSSVQINAVTASVDANITAGNIKNGVSILGVTGSYTGEGIIPTGTLQITRNGIQDVTQYASVDVNVPSQNTDFFCIEANAASTVQLKPYGGYIFYYSSDKTNWSEASANTTLNLAQGDKVYFYGNQAPGKQHNSGSYNTTIQLSSGSVFLSGELMTLCYFSGGNFPPVDGFAFLFMNSTATIDASDLIFPSNTSDYCYNCMFLACSGLMAAPALPAMSVAKYSYGGMFKNCTSLTQAPALPATTLSSNSYFEMFSGCTALTQAPTLPATDLTNASYCYSYMFYNCTALTQAPTLPATKLDSAGGCYQNMFGCCTALTQAPTLPATKLVNECYAHMFTNCTALTESPDLTQITAIGYNAMTNMFKGCVNLSKLYIPNVSTWNTSYTNNWVNNVAATGTVLRINEDVTIPVGTSGIPSGWTTIVSPTISVDYTNMEIIVSTDVVGADLYYSVNDTDTPAQFTQYTGPIPVQSGSNYIGVRAYLIDSSVISAINRNSYNNYFYIEADAGNSATVTIANSSPAYSKQNTEFSFDRETWTNANTVQNITVPAGDRVYLRRKVTSNNYKYGEFYSKITLSNYCKAGGCMSSLIYNDCRPNQVALASAFRELFYGSVYITDVSNLILDVDISDANYVLYQTFYDCRNLTAALDLSSITTINGSQALSQSFYGCTSLTTAPDLSSITTINGSQAMVALFRECTSLSSIKAPNVSTWSTSVFADWVNRVAATGTIYAPTGVTIPTDTSGIPSNWTRVNY